MERTQLPGKTGIAQHAGRERLAAQVRDPGRAPLGEIEERDVEREGREREAVEPEGAVRVRGDAADEIVGGRPRRGDDPGFGRGRDPAQERARSVEPRGSRARDQDDRESSRPASATIEAVAMVTRIAVSMWRNSFGPWALL